MEQIEAHEPAAAVIIQKTYRGYRSRRKLADAAIMAKKYGWWNIVDAAILQHNTETYYAHSTSWRSHENWTRLKRKASKVGKGLAKNNKALKLALQHWLEAIDARHRYGHNLRPYYLHWLEQHDTREPFFYWLDIGAGREVELEKCSRAKLQKQQIKYLGPEQRKHYEVIIYEGKLYYKASSELVHTPYPDRWIFVMSPYGKLYIGKKEKGVLQHSSFLAGGATTAAGRLQVTNGVLKLMEAHSGHYRPSPENFKALVDVLLESGADLALTKVQLVSDDLLPAKASGRDAVELADEVKSAIEGVCGDEGFSASIQSQHLTSVDSMAEESVNAVVTNLTFQKEEVKITQSILPEHTPAELAKEDMDKLGRENRSEESQEEVKTNMTGGKEAEEAEGSALETLIQLPSKRMEEAERFSIQGNKPVSMSPGFSRNASLMSLTPTERCKALDGFGPREKLSTLAYQPS